MCTKDSLAASALKDEVENEEKRGKLKLSVAFKTH